MAHDSGEPHLPEAELYMLTDKRCEGRYVGHGRQFDDDPATSQALRQANLARWREIDPAWHPGSVLPPLKNFRVWEELPLPSEFAPRSAAFSRMMPAAIAHTERVYAYGYDPQHHGEGIYITVVSGTWKRCIESVEPGIHEFFPFELRFKDNVMKDYFMFRARLFVDLVDNAASDVWSNRYADGINWYSLKIDPKFVTAKRRAVQGRHWVVHLNDGHYSYHCPFLSRDLAFLLHKLLPRKCSLVPVNISDTA